MTESITWITPFEAMMSDTLETGLARYRIGHRIRGLRQAKGLGLVELGEYTGLSPGMLSKIERDKLFPTLPSLLRIAMVFGVGLDHFFAAEIHLDAGDAITFDSAASHSYRRIGAPDCTGIVVISR